MVDIYDLQVWWKTSALNELSTTVSVSLCDHGGATISETKDWVVNNTDNRYFNRLEVDTRNATSNGC